jgi:arylsulfatase A-like enzyme
MGREHGFLSEMLLEHGYNTFAIGKWHLAPPEETSAAGPFSRWPLGRGFERYYGFLRISPKREHMDRGGVNAWIGNVNAGIGTM